jgi:hypothetical protein
MSAPIIAAFEPYTELRVSALAAAHPETAELDCNPAARRG